METQLKFLNWHFSKYIYALAYPDKYLHIWKTNFTSYNQYSFGILFLRNAKTAHTDEGILQSFLQQLQKSLFQVFISLIQLASMSFIPYDNWRTLFFTQTYRYSEVWCNHHVTAFFVTIVLVEISILHPLCECYTRPLCECYSFFLIKRVFKTQNLPGSMLFSKSCNQMFMTRICFYKLFLISENKTQSFWQFPYNDHRNVIKFMKITSNSTQSR